MEKIKIPIVKFKKELSIHDFPVVHRWDDEYGWCESGIRWEDCEKIMGKIMYKKFQDWMMGATYGQDGAYLWDVKQFLKGGKSFD
jgi:hypothetical protein